MTDQPRDDIQAIFVPEGRHVVPTVFAVGPWRPDAVHGAAIAALFAATLHRPDMDVARITVDLAAAVRLNPLRLELQDLGGGRRVQRRSAVLHDGERAVAGHWRCMSRRNLPDFPPPWDRRRPRHRPHRSRPCPNPEPDSPGQSG